MTVELRLKESRYKMCVSGAAETGHCGLDAFDKAKELGREIALHGGITVTGATTGFPTWSAMGAKEVGGISIGFSPASTEQEHLNAYRLPLEYLDLVVYTGFGFSGRNLILTRSTDAVFIGCGRIGTINEFTIAYEDQKPIGILRGSWETDEVIEEIMAKGFRPNERVVFDDDPKRLVEKVIALIDKDKGLVNRVYRNTDVMSGREGNLIL
ncbi:MAG TPA: hypothetical protein VD967_03045 [Candidatus Paceibacterota bacterium]|nr:hypothetical protein [Candidatus Paceibacterota bacterium]